MSAAETLYTARAPYPDVLERARQQVVALPVYRDGALAVPSAGTFTLWGPGDHTTAIVAAAAVTVTSSIATYTLTTTHLAATRELGEGYLEEWALLIDGVTHTFRRTAALARRALYPVYSDVDALAEYPALTRDIASTASSLQGYLDEAWRQILGTLAERRVYPYLVMTPDSFRSVHRHTTLHLVFKSFQRGGQGTADKWMELARYHGEQAEKAWISLTTQMDLDHDGFVDSEARSRATNVIHVNASGPQALFYHRHPL